MVYILKGWVKFEYEGQGIKILKPDDCVLQPAGIKHREIEHSANLELILAVLMFRGCGCGWFISLTANPR